MIQISQLKKSYGTEVLFDDVTLTLSRGDKVGFVGRNGSGKSTLFRLISGEEEVDSGQILIPSNYRIGELKQHLHFTKATVLEECCQELSVDEQHQQYRVEKILSGLGFSKEQMQQSPHEFSGGFQIRINLARLLIKSPDLLLLDEPTNYLDIVSVRWLKQFLKDFQSEFILITHDRGFMDEVTHFTMGIHRKKIKKVFGDTLKYHEQLSAEEELYEKAQVKQEHAVRHMQKYIDRFRASARRASQAQSRIKKLEKLKDMADLDQVENLNFHFNYKPCPAKILKEYQDLSFTWPKMERQLIENFNLFVHQGDRIAIIGKNGSGKSTLLNLMAGELESATGKMLTHPQTEISLFGQTNINRLHLQHTIEEEIALANPALGYGQVKSICGLMMFSGDLSAKPIKVLSGGEKSRVLLGRILARETNLLLLDEPTNHLDHESIEGLLEGLEDFEGAVILVTHSEMILRRFATKLIVFQNQEISVFDGSYDDFLSRVGWQEDGDSSSQNASSETGLSKKEKRRQRSVLVAEKARLLTPLKNKISKIENEIVAQESRIEVLNKELIQVSMNQEVQRSVDLSKELNLLKKNIDVLFEDLEEMTLQYEDETKKFIEMYGEVP